MSSIPSLEAIRDWCNEKFTLKKASSNALGGIKVGSGLSIAQDGTLSASSSGASNLNELNDVVLTGIATGDILTYNSTRSKWYPKPEKRFEILYYSGGLNTYAVTGSNVPFDLNFPDISEIRDFDELAIMMGFTDDTYSEENYLEVRFNVRLYESYATNWKASTYKGINLTFNDDAANDERTIIFGLTNRNLPDHPYMQYCFRYSYSSSLTERLPGIRKIYLDPSYPATITKRQGLWPVHGCIDCIFQ